MKKIILISSFFSLTLILNAQNKNVYIVIDTQYQNLYKFDKKIDIKEESYFSSMKILIYDKKHEGFSSKGNNINDNDILVVKEQPAYNSYYEFESYKKPKTIVNIDNLKLYSIEDVSKNSEANSIVWGNYNYSLVFIEKIDCGFKLWKMKPVYQE